MKKTNIVNTKELIANLRKFVLQFGYEIVPKRRLLDFILFEYDNYDHYKNEQVKWNKKKINNVWADENTLKRCADIVIRNSSSDFPITGICHGSRNGFEVKKLKSLIANSDIIGTDISENAANYGLYIWDFHDVNKEWVNNFDFVYSNSLDQSWKPKLAIETWLEQLKPKGRLLLEHTDYHGPEYASEMDPFGVRPNVFPFILTKWFGNRISISHTKAKKKNMKLDSYVFEIAKTQQY